jgi:serine/threonine protein kinase/curli biogenesis system outer membrane secretion channel CsgG
MISTPCPDLQDLQRFSLGQDDEATAGHIESHLSDCRRCVAALDHLDASDELIEAAHAHGLQREPPLRADRVEGLIERLKALNPTTMIAVPSDPCTPLLAPPQAPDEIGRLGAYRVRQVLGSGGMGIVYLAEDTRLQRPIALKVLRPALAEDVRIRQRFLREARAIAAVDNDHIVPIYEVSEDRGLPFLAMPVLHGETLAARLAREGRLPAEEVRRIGREVAQALEAVHRRGLVHRDVKPANIWLEAPVEGGASRVKLLDFGLVQTANERAGLTECGAIIGTPEYMAPEQAGGEPVDARADLFSLGSVLYAMAAGRAPFHGSNSLAVLRCVCDDAPLAIEELAPDLPQDLIQLIHKLHAKDPSQRCRSAQEVIEWLDREPRRAIPSRRRSTVKRWRLAAALLLFTIGGLTLWATQLTRFGQPSAEGLTQAPEKRAVEADPNPGDEGDANPRAVAVADDEPAQAQPGQAVVPLAILGFDEKGIGVRELGGQVTDLLFARLSAKDDVLLVERADLAKALKELELGLSGAIRKDSAPRVGQLTGARLLVYGSVLQIDKRRHLVAKLVSVETGRIVGVTVDAPASGELGALVTQLADKLADKLAHPPDGFLPKSEKKGDKMAALKRQLGREKRPVLWVHIKESSPLRPAPDPAAQTEVINVAKAVDFEVVDAEEGAKGQAQILITGEGLSEIGSRHGGLVSAKARLEVKVVDRASGKVIAMERQTALVVDSTEQLAGKAALQEAADAIVYRILPKLVKR